MNVLCILGSPRKDGNSTTMAKQFISEAKQRGATVRTYRLNDIKYKPCQACYICKTKLEHCTLNDDLTPVLDAWIESELIVIATPIYFGDITAQTKAFIDRTFSFAKPDFHERPDPVRYAPGKKMLWLTSQDSPPEFYEDVSARYGVLFQNYGKFDIHRIRATEVTLPGEVKENKDIMDKAVEMAQQLIPVD